MTIITKASLLLTIKNADDKKQNSESKTTGKQIKIPFKRIDFNFSDEMISFKERKMKAIGRERSNNNVFLIVSFVKMMI